MITHQATQDCRRGHRTLAAWGLAITLWGTAGGSGASAAGMRAYSFTTIAGQPGAWGWENGSSYSCAFFNPNALALDAQGNLYVADSLNHLLRVLRPDGSVETPAGRALPNDGAGHHQLEPGDGQGSAAHFYYPDGLTINRAGNLVIADAWHHTLREMTPEGQVTTWVGQSLESGYADGPANEARLNNPVGLATDAAGNIYVADRDNHLVRKVAPDGEVSTVAGQPGQSGALDGPAGDASFNHPSGLAFDRQGNLFIADTDNAVIRKLTPAGQVSTVAGLAGSIGHADGPAWAARFFSPTGVAVDGEGNVLVTDQGSHVIRLITPAGDVRTVGGSPGVGGWDDGVGGAARFYCPFSLVVAANGDLLIADAGNHIVRRGTLLPEIRPALQLVEGHPRLRITGPADVEGFVQYRNALDDAEGWQDLAPFRLIGGISVITDFDANAGTQRFYRLRP